MAHAYRYRKGRLERKEKSNGHEWVLSLHALVSKQRLSLPFRARFFVALNIHKLDAGNLVLQYLYG